MKPSDFSRHLSNFLTQYLPIECGASNNTIQAYSHTFTIFLQYMKTEMRIKPEHICLKDISKGLIIDFLNWIENERRCSISTRNARLATIHSFFKYLQYRDVKGLNTWQEVLSVKFKKQTHAEMAYLTADGMQLVLKQIDVSTKRGRRDLALLGLLYDSGARVQELINLTPSELRFENITTIILRGKGKKARVVPLAESQVHNLKHYMQENDLFEYRNHTHPLFSNPQGNRLSRMAILDIVKKYTELARNKNPELIPLKIGCHSLRHSKAMHMLEAEINLIYIRDFLGHSSATTTEVYARANAKMKMEALQKVNPGIVKDRKTRWQKDGELLSWLKDIQRKY